ncbi:MAG: hypothetical protein GKR90_22395 [Pseudomonadales bacterium]|nr:hypothetical protein [Pseudomonadales bacterium]
MLKSRISTIAILGLTIAVALVLIIDRGGLIAWSAFVIGVVLLAKSWFKPRKLDLVLAGGLAIFSLLAWLGSFYYVISTYESGEVIELTIDTKSGLHTARLWVFEHGGPGPVIYYDAEPEAAESLLAGRSLQFTRDGAVNTQIPNARRVEAIPEEEASGILEAMATKYGDRMIAADVYYLLVGRPRDRVALVIRLDGV